jgi:hypothetical protein
MPRWRALVEQSLSCRRFASPLAEDDAAIVTLSAKSAFSANRKNRRQDDSSANGGNRYAYNLPCAAGLIEESAEARLTVPFKTSTWPEIRLGIASK